MVQRITLAPQGPEFSRFVMGYWRLMDWNMSPLQLASFIEEHIDLGVTTVDHADIYGGYQCEAAFGEALKLRLNRAQRRAHAPFGEFAADRLGRLRRTGERKEKLEGKGVVGHDAKNGANSMRTRRFVTVK